MAAANGKSGGAAPSLSSLRTALQKAPAAKAGASPAAAAKQGGQPPAPAQGMKRSLPADATNAGAPPPKKLIVKAPAGGTVGKAGPGAITKAPGVGAIAKVSGGGAITKSPGALMKSPSVGAPAKSPGVGSLAKPPFTGTLAKAPLAAPAANLQPNANVAKVARPSTIAKVPSSGTISKSPASGGVAKAPGVGNVAKLSGSGAAVKAPSTGIVKAVSAGLATKSGSLAMSPSALDGAASKGQDGGLSPAAVSELVATIDAATGSAKIRSVVRLADAMGQNLQIEHINHFLRALKKKVIERAQRDGVRVPVTKAASAVTKPAPAGAQPAGAKAATPPTSVAAKAPVKAPATGVAGPAAGPGIAAGKQGAVPKTATSVPQPPPKAKAPAEAKPKPPQPPPQPQPAEAAEGQAPPPASPPPSEPGDDPLYVLVGELAADPVCSDGAMNEVRLGEVLKRLWDGVARKPKDWIAAWQAMTIPADKQIEALQKFLNMTFTQTADPDRAPMVIAELVKAHRVKMRSVEEVLVAFGHNLDGILAINEDAWHVYAQFLVHVFPKPAASGWGWSRVGWSWQSWWKFVEQCIQSLEPSRASDVLCMILRVIQDREGQPLEEVQAWTEGDKLQRVVAKLCELGTCESSEAVEKLSTQGVVVNL